MIHMMLNLVYLIDLNVSGTIIIPYKQLFSLLQELIIAFVHMVAC